MSHWVENDCVGCPQGCIKCGRHIDYYVFECDGNCGKISTREEDFIHDGEEDYCPECFERIFGKDEDK